MIFIITVALSDAKTKVENMKIVVNVLEDEKHKVSFMTFLTMILCVKSRILYMARFILYLFICYTMHLNYTSLEFLRINTCPTVLKPPTIDGIEMYNLTPISLRSNIATM